MSHAQMTTALLVFLVACIGLWMVRRRYSAYTIGQWILLFIAKWLVRFRWRATQPKHWPVPRDQGAIIVCNHRSSVDPFFIQTLSDRPIRWMVAREYCQHWFIGFFLRICNVIPVGRAGIDTAATKAAIRCAEAGGMVGMLPEGRINMTDDFMLPVRPGAVLVALRAGVPILPCYVEGSPYRDTSVASPLFMRARAKVVVGELIDLSEYYGRETDAEVVGQLTLQVVQQIAHLAGRADFQPQLAGRRWKPSQQELDELV